MNSIVEPHAFGTYAPVGAEILIIGTFPTHKRNWAFEFFYPNSQNVFWEVIGSVYNYSFQVSAGKEAVVERKDFAKLHKIALTDMLAKAIRDKDSSGDDQLIPVELMDILSILKSNKTIHRLVLTSRSGKNSALNLLRCHLIENKIAFYESKINNIIYGHFERFGIRYDVVVPYSPSPRVIRRYGPVVLKHMYENALIGEPQKIS